MVKLRIQSRCVFEVSLTCARVVFCLTESHVGDDPMLACGVNEARGILSDCTSGCYWDPAVTLRDFNDTYLVCATELEGLYNEDAIKGATPPFFN